MGKERKQPQNGAEEGTGSAVIAARQMSAPSSAHCLSEMWLASDSMMSRRSGWLRERRFGNLETFKEKKNRTEKHQEMKTLPRWQLIAAALPPCPGQCEVRNHSWVQDLALTTSHKCTEGKGGEHSRNADPSTREQ